jgi:hypothetical protein
MNEIEKIKQHMRKAEWKKAFDIVNELKSQGRKIEFYRHQKGIDFLYYFIDFETETRTEKEIKQHYLNKFNQLLINKYKK